MLLLVILRLLGLGLAEGERQLELFLLLQLLLRLARRRLRLLGQRAAEVDGGQGVARCLGRRAVGAAGLLQHLEAAVADAHLLFDAVLGQRGGLGGALAAKHLATVAAVVLALREGEGDAATVADLAVDPVRGRVRGEHGVGLFQLREGAALRLEDVHRVLEGHGEGERVSDDWF